MNFLLNFISLLLIPTSTIFYILAVICFCAFLVVLLWYLLWNKKDKPSKQTKSWTIESAKKFLESNNIQVNVNSKEHVEENNEDEETHKDNLEEIVEDKTKTSEENVTKTKETKIVKSATPKKPVAHKTTSKPTAKSVSKSTTKTTIKKD